MATWRTRGHVAAGQATTGGGRERDADGERERRMGGAHRGAAAASRAADREGGRQREDGELSDRKQRCDDFILLACRDPWSRWEPGGPRRGQDARLFPLRDAGRASADVYRARLWHHGPRPRLPTSRACPSCDGRVPMRFCMVTTFYPPRHLGGDAVYVQALVARARARGPRRRRRLLARTPTSGRREPLAAAANPGAGRRRRRRRRIGSEAPSRAVVVALGAPDGLAGPDPRGDRVASSTAASTSSTTTTSR